VPLSQLCEQQSPNALHAWPFGLHCADAHFPDRQSWLQQSALAWQAAPSAAHVGWAHVPFVHVPLQQSPADEHD